MKNKRDTMHEYEKGKNINVMTLHLNNQIIYLEISYTLVIERKCLTNLLSYAS